MFFSNDRLEINVIFRSEQQGKSGAVRCTHNIESYLQDWDWVGIVFHRDHLFEFHPEDTETHQDSVEPRTIFSPEALQLEETGSCWQSVFNLVVRDDLPFLPHCLFWWSKLVFSVWLKRCVCVSMLSSYWGEVKSQALMITVGSEPF